MARVYINGMFLTQRKTGIQRFSHEMCQAMAAAGHDIAVIAPRRIRKDYNLSYPVIHIGLLTGVFWEHLELLIYLLKRRKPLLISFGSPGPLLYKKRIVTIHDVSFYYHPEWFSRLYGLYYRIITPIIARFSEKILTVSHFSKKEILGWLNIPEEKITIVHNAVSQSMVNKAKGQAGPTEKYILTVGSLDPRKNLSTIIEAYHQTGLEKTIKLKAAGGESPLFNMDKNTHLSNVSLGYVTDQELFTLYKNAELFIYASFYEGFGIPPLEAMASGCPVVLSDIPVFKEIFGDAAMYVKPGDAQGMAKKIIEILNTPQLKNILIQKGYKKSKEYTWEKSAQVIGKLIEERYK